MTKINQDLQFIALDPRKRKRALIAGLLAPLGAMTWWRIPPFGLRGYPETTEKVYLAAEAAIVPARSRLTRMIQRSLYAMFYNGSRTFFERHPDAVAVVWNGLNGVRRVFADGARDAGARTLFFELAPFRDRITCDPLGVNYANSLPRRTGPYLDWAAQSATPPDAWQAERARIRQRAPLRASPVRKGASITSGPFLFAPLQVPGDSQLRLFGGAFRTVPDFIDALVAASESLPEGWHLRIKEHPSSGQSYAHLVLGPRVVLDNASDTFDLVSRSEGVVTVNSSVGLEAMFFERPVVACGQCFWAIPGVADLAPDRKALASRFAEAPLLSFDPDARSAFLNYLLCEYYIATDGSDRNSSAKIKSRLAPGAP